MELSEIYIRWEYGISNISLTEEGYKFRNGYGLEVPIADEVAKEAIKELGLEEEKKKPIFNKIHSVFI